MDSAIPCGEVTEFFGDIVIVDGVVYELDELDAPSDLDDYGCDD